MAPSIRPERPWHEAHSPEEWNALLQHVLKVHRQNPQDTDAMEAIQQINEALNAYDQPAITAGEHTLGRQSKALGGDYFEGLGNPIEAVKGVGEGTLSALAAPFIAANTLYRHGPSAVIDDLVQGIKQIPKDAMSGDARRLGNLTGQTAGTILGSKVMGGLVSGGKAGITSIGEFLERPKIVNDLNRAKIAKLTTETPLNRALLEARTNTANQVGRRAGAVADATEAHAPIRSRILESQAETAAGRATQTPLQKALLESRLQQVTEQGPIKTSMLEKSSALKDAALEQAPLRTKILENQVQRGPMALDQLAAQLEATKAGTQLKNIAIEDAPVKSQMGHTKLLDAQNSLLTGMDQAPGLLEGIGLRNINTDLRNQLLERAVNPEPPPIPEMEPIRPTIEPARPQNASARAMQKALQASRKER